MSESKRQWGKQYYLRYDQEMEWYLTEPEESTFKTDTRRVK